jgi:hypothetical protein
MTHRRNFLLGDDATLFGRCYLLVKSGDANYRNNCATAVNTNRALTSSIAIPLIARRIERGRASAMTLIQLGFTRFVGQA